ncbi:branched-chain amino acid ABC transporter permease [Pseudomonas monteilii]|uniref:High-affinity branched-chain amino acid ABC transporter permease BraD n=2 Tax=Pseudomonas putida group TaxID=136845 RepID=A0AAE6RBK7_9PSED|nr:MULTISPECIES: branched-chain amino acid ABC transporter permease [Pseudomonas]MBB3270252.1 branched-chain amino acid transport system permease protein [Pseudomonas sp. OG7]MBH3455793.1 branched-chain amino acid ABC transporter permease [Pseudomonas monteilii]MCJ7853474.1 branched-chain amino acid ABC transporter permease [Pseudomonas monteilii]MDD2123755.1 branched-chain amino acid ABC transporter permease [Pseudomonas monteilii]MDI3368904.1 branched-chain amino acid ABC transporter permeas
MDGNFDILLQQVLNGLVLGSIYALVALGYTMVYGIIGLINFAHGEVVMVGAMVTISVLTMLAGAGFAPGLITLLLAIMAAVVVCMLLAQGMEKYAYRPLRKAPRLTPLILAIGISIALQNLAMMIWGRGYKTFPEVVETQPVDVFGATVTNVQLSIMLIAVVIMLGLWLLVDKTRLGKAMRATAQNQEVAGLMGININRVISATFLIGASLGAIAGVMRAINYGQADAYMGLLLGLKAFSAAVLGGIGNLFGAMAGGLLLGLIESLAAGYTGQITGGFLGANYQDIFAFAVLILVLLFRPNGLLGERQADRA